MVKTNPVSTYDQLIDSYKVTGGDAEVIPSYDFVSAPWGLGLKLFPTQRFLLRMLFGEKLDDTTKDIHVRNMLGDTVKYELTEAEYLTYLYNEGRCSIGFQPKGGIDELIWSGGRKATKSTIVSTVLLYQLYRFLAFYNPHLEFGVMPDSQVRLTNLASSEDQAGIVFSNVSSGVANSPFFQSLLGYDPSTTKIQVFTRSQYDRKHGKTGKKPRKHLRPSVVVTVAPSTSRSVRGPNNLILIFDEIAHFIAKSKDQSGESLYGALKPSIASFAGFAKTLLISSPGPRNGIFWTQHKLAMDKGTEEIVYLETPTAEFNPNISAKYLRSEYDRDAAYFMVEYGAKWEGAQYKFIQRPELLDDSVSHKPASTPMHGFATEPHYTGIDVGTVSDGTAYAVAHADGNVVVVDNVIWFYAGVEPYEDVESLPFLEEVEGGKDLGLVIDLREFVGRFPIRGGLTDQHEGRGFSSLAGLKKMTWIEVEHYNQQKNWEVAEVFDLMLREGRLRMPDIPGVTENLKDLDRIYVDKKIGDKKIYQVRSPEAGSGDHPPKGHDDIWSAVSRAVYLVFMKEISTGKAERRSKNRKRAMDRAGVKRKNPATTVGQSTRMEQLKHGRGQQKQTSVAIRSGRRR